jgi:hypothetical protein
VEIFHDNSLGRVVLGYSKDFDQRAVHLIYIEGNINGIVDAWPGCDACISTMVTIR